MGADALRAVRTRIEQGWSQSADARDASGEAVPLGDDDARAWSLRGAFALAATDGIPTNHVQPALRALAALTEADSLAEWNDFPNRTQREVLDLLDSALARMESGPVEPD